MLIRPPDTTTNQLLKPSHQQKNSLKVQTKLLSPLLEGHGYSNSKSAVQLQRPTTAQTLSRNPNPGPLPKKLLSPRSKKINLIIKNALTCVEDIPDERIQVPSNVYQFRQFVPQRSKSPDGTFKIKHKPGSFTQRTLSKAENSRPLKTEFDSYERDSPFHIRDHGEYNLPIEGLNLSRRLSSEKDSPILRQTPLAANKKYVVLEYEKVRDVPYPIIQSTTPEIIVGSHIENLSVGRPLLSPKIKKIVNPNAKDIRVTGTRSKKQRRNERNTPSVENNEGKILSCDKDNREQKKMKEVPMSQAMFRMKEFKRVKTIVSKRKAMNSGSNHFVPNESQSKFFNIEKQFPSAHRQEDQRRAIQMYMIKKNEEYLRHRLFVNEKPPIVNDNSLEFLDRDSKELPDIGGESIDRTKYLSRHRTDISQDYTEQSTQQRLRTLPEDKMEISFSGPRKGNQTVFTRQVYQRHQSEEDNSHVWNNLRKSQVLTMEKRKSSGNKLKTDVSGLPEFNKLDMTRFLKILDKQQKPTLFSGEGGSTALSTERKREADGKDSKTLPTVLQKQKSEREFLITHYDSNPQPDAQKFKLIYPSKKKVYVKPSTPSKGTALGHLLAPRSQEMILSKDSLKTPVNATNKLSATKVMEEMNELSQISIKQGEIYESFEFENLVK